MKLDILAIAAHPDDAELSCSGTLIKEAQSGKAVGILDLTRGEMGTRGTPEDRDAEAAAASAIMGLQLRENLGFRDGFFKNDETHQLAIIQILRKYQPDMVLANAIYDRHPDHGRGAALAREACFLSGLRRIETKDEKGEPQEAWRPKTVCHYIQDRWIKPDFVVDISETMELKMEAIKAFKTQFFDPDSAEPETYISKPDFLEGIYARAREFGRPVGFTFAEGYTLDRTPGYSSISLLQ